MTLDINRTKEVLNIVHPYLKWIAIATYGVIFLYINRMFIKDPVLRKWLMASLEERDGKASGKSITSFVFAKLIAISTITAIIYAPNHLLPEYFLISLLTFVGGLYGVKVASKYYDGKNNTTTTFTESNTNTSSTSSTSNSDTTSNQTQSTDNNNLDNNKDEVKKDDFKKDTFSDSTSKNKPEDLG